MSRTSRLDRLLPKPLSYVVVPEVVEAASVRRRRRGVVAATAVTGAGLLGRSLSTPPGSRRFYLSTAAVAAVWTAGGLTSGPLHLGWIENRDATLRRPVLTPAATGLAAFGVFYGAALAARRIPALGDAVARVLRFAEEGDDRLVLATTLANGVGEEIFFRGALYAALGQHHPVTTSTAVYVLATTTTTRNPALVLAAATMGTLFGLQRRASGGLQAPLITHGVWSALMLRFLPPLFRDRAPNPGPAALDRLTPGR
ncbi:CPBP family intramembrane glutamic endopeptidase [Nocardioides daeguensis]|uniref:CPBP family intramembrane metalloprotease n=1 Tax=Nocardioides daeguensis TaxID=908359 RepID=A0ABP6V7H9_9ACTN|nr:CPBP family intramembrane glutamic endopeptidase [Nocardioides daeguensis]MBV6726247.1 CPBP family intramembrane metalloprotease [Nocardioides daeguensis]MCR1772090.1 CPBP family intramembrane metalloprotease [Nocardioides daeguensis]